MHIKHPFELQSINNSQELYDFYCRVLEKLSICPEQFSQKFDGINVSFQLVDEEFVLVNKSGKKQSLFEIINSKSPQALKEKYVKCIKTFNVLYKNGFKGLFLRLDLDNPNVVLNCEYINGRQNVISYSKEAIIMNGIIKNTKDGTQFSKISEAKLATMSKVLECHNLIPVYPTIVPSNGSKLATMTQIFDLPDDSWGLPRHPKFRMVSSDEEIDKSKITRDTFNKFINGEIDTEDRVLIDTMKLVWLNVRWGQRVKEIVEYNEQFSDETEGLVFQDDRSGELIKLTGEFYKSNFTQASKFSQYFVAVAAMKPPHKGHLKLIKDILIKCRQYNSKFILILGEKDRDGFDIEKTLNILSMYFENEGLDTRNLEILTSESPTEKMDEIFSTTKEKSTFNLVSGESDSLRNDAFIKRLSEKFDHYFESCVILDEKGRSDDKVSSTGLRSAIKHGNYLEYLDYVPKTSKKDAEKIWNILCDRTIQENTKNYSDNYCKIYVG